MGSVMIIVLLVLQKSTSRVFKICTDACRRGANYLNLNDGTVI